MNPALLGKSSINQRMELARKKVAGTYSFKRGKSRVNPNTETESQPRKRYSKELRDNQISGLTEELNKITTEVQILDKTQTEIDQL